MGSNVIPAPAQAITSPHSDQGLNGFAFVNQFAFDMDVSPAGLSYGVTRSLEITGVREATRITLIGRVGAFFSYGFASVKFPDLEHCYNPILIDSFPDLRLIDFPRLGSLFTESLSITACVAQLALSFNSLTNPSTVTLDENGLTSVSFRAMTQCNGHFILARNAGTSGDPFPTGYPQCSLSLPALTTVVNSFQIQKVRLSSLSFPLLASVLQDVIFDRVEVSSIALTMGTIGGALVIWDCTCTVIVALGLEGIGTYFDADYSPLGIGTQVSISIANNLSLTALSLTALVDSASNTLISGNTSLAILNLTNWNPPDGKTHDFRNNALLDTWVNVILARCVAAGLTTSVIKLEGGTNAAPTGQGIVDAAALVTAGCTVTTN